ncbi:hypothetical protein ACROYT_G008706 [Oculina patagonica]
MYTAIWQHVFSSTFAVYSLNSNQAKELVALTYPITSTTICPGVMKTICVVVLAVLIVAVTSVPRRSYEEKAKRGLGEMRFD